MKTISLDPECLGILLTYRWWTRLWICNILKAWTEHFVSVWYCNNLLYCYYVLAILIGVCIHFLCWTGINEVKWSEVKWSEVKWSEVKWSEVKWRELKWGEDQLNAMNGRELRRGEIWTVFKGSEEEWSLGLGETCEIECCRVWFTVQYTEWFLKLIHLI
jgi:hypothetical protein